MKISGFFLVFCVFGAMAFAQDKTVTDTNALPDIGMLNTTTYSSYFGFEKGNVNPNNSYVLKGY
jgi:hypothetical protein